MRSHTGDRPYKCQHCGDQFARSDLLSRHVNKCHAAEKALAPSATQPGRRKGTTAATRATTSKQACDQCVQSSLPCDGSNPCAKCVARKTRCTFVKFHRQTAPVGPGHPSSLSASSLSSLSSLPHSGSASSLGLPPHAPLSHPTLSLGGLGGGEGQPTFLYAQQAASGAGFHGQAQPQPAFSANEPGARFGERFAHHPDGHGHGSRFAHHPGGGGSNAGSPTSAYAEGYERRERDGLPYNYPNPHAPSGYTYAGEYEYDYADSEHSGTSGASVGGSLNGSVSGGSRPASSAGIGGDYGAPYLPNGRHNASASLDLHDMRHHPGDLHHVGDLHRPPEFSSAFGLMSLDDPNVLAGLAPDGVPFFSSAATSAAGRTGLTPGVGSAPPHPDKRSSMQLVPPQPLAYQPYSPPSSSHSHSGSVTHSSSGGMGQQTPGSREAETRELREFWKAYMRTPLTGPAGADALGLQTPSASTAASAGMLGVTPTRESVAGGNGTRRFRVASLPSVKTPEGEMDAAPVYPVHHHSSSSSQHHHQPHAPLPPLAGARTMHNPDDLRSYEAAVLARKAPELVLRKPGKRPVTSAGVSTQVSQAPQQPPIFEFGAAGRERGRGGGRWTGPLGYAAAPGTSQPSASSLPNSPFPGTPDSGASVGTGTSASEDGDVSSGEGGGVVPPHVQEATEPDAGAAADEEAKGSHGRGAGADACAAAADRGAGAAAEPAAQRAAERECVSGPPDDCAEGAAGGASAAEGAEAERACVADGAGVCGGLEELDGGGGNR
ncbi:Zinc finger/binuclear cluster transcriptional regulator [Mycena venus]|uniref:Zinc finger/binuclear cluster transcriptional regulator n=1 Tax=Mycena venus TaxID=2733690 RepID=A0A8H7CET7_9AGAR|nr:Zinc finger/binuclear cluster transcriptional regulator [Mycena venus]